MLTEDKVHDYVDYLRKETDRAVKYQNAMVAKRKILADVKRQMVKLTSQRDEASSSLDEIERGARKCCRRRNSIVWRTAVMDTIPQTQLRPSTSMPLALQTHEQLSIYSNLPSDALMSYRYPHLTAHNRIIVHCSAGPRSRFKGLRPHKVHIFFAAPID